MGGCLKGGWSDAHAELLAIMWRERGGTAELGVFGSFDGFER